MQTSIRTDAVFRDLLRVTPLRPFVTAIVARVQPRTSEGHADLASSPPSSPVRGQSRLTLVTGNEGCVRYPTEGNDSNHELTTVLSPILLLARTILSPSCNFMKLRLELAFYGSVTPASAGTSPIFPLFLEKGRESLYRCWNTHFWSRYCIPADCADKRLCDIF